MNAVKITLLGEETEIPGGLYHVDHLYKQTDTDPQEKWLYLNKEAGIDIPLLPDDRLIIHGGENIFADTASADISKNPDVRTPACFELNGTRVENGSQKAKLTARELRELDTELSTTRLFLDLRGEVDKLLDDDWVLVIQAHDRYFTVPVDTDNEIDLEECAKHERKPPKGQKSYRIKIDAERKKVATAVMTGAAILALIDKTYEEWTLSRKFRGGRRKPIGPDEEVDFSEPGVERFETVKRQAQQGW